MNREEYDEALAAVTEAARVYRGGVNDPAAGENTETVWSPIYADLLADLAARLHITGAAYDRAANELGISDAERFDWQALLAKP